MDEKYIKTKSFKYRSSIQKVQRRRFENLSTFYSSIPCNIELAFNKINPSRACLGFCISKDFFKSGKWTSQCNKTSILEISANHSWWLLFTDKSLLCNWIHQPAGMSSPFSLYQVMVEVIMLIKSVYAEGIHWSVTASVWYANNFLFKMKKKRVQSEREKMFFLLKRMRFN